MNKIVLHRITSENINQAVGIAREIFPYENNKAGVFLPEKEYRLSLTTHETTTRFFIATLGDTPIGITGSYHHFNHPKKDELWLAYFGILNVFRGKGLSCQMLGQTIYDMVAWNNQLRTIKILTSVRPEEHNCIGLYKKFGFTKYTSRKSTPFDWHYYRLNI